MHASAQTFLRFSLHPFTQNFTLPHTCAHLGFPTGRDSATFWDKGTEVPLLSRDKGTTGQAQNLAKGRDGPGQPKSGTGRGTGCSKTV